MAVIDNKNFPINRPDSIEQAQMKDTLYQLKDKINGTLNNIQTLISNETSLDGAVQLTFNTLKKQLDDFIQSSSEELTTQIHQLTTKHDEEVRSLQETIDTLRIDLTRAIEDSKNYQ